MVSGCDWFYWTTAIVMVHICEVCVTCVLCQERKMSSVLSSSQQPEEKGAAVAPFSRWDSSDRGVRVPGSVRPERVGRGPPLSFVWCRGCFPLPTLRSKPPLSLQGEGWSAVASLRTHRIMKGFSSESWKQYVFLTKWAVTLIAVPYCSIPFYVLIH